MHGQSPMAPLHKGDTKRAHVPPSASFPSLPLPPALSSSSSVHPSIRSISKTSVVLHSFNYQSLFKKPSTRISQSYASFYSLFNDSSNSTLAVLFQTHIHIQDAFLSCFRCSLRWCRCCHAGLWQQQRLRTPGLRS